MTDMRLLISILMFGQLMSCMRQPIVTSYSQKTPYRPDPLVEVSMLMAKDRVVAAYVRHSSGSVLFRLAADKADREYAGGIDDIKSVVTLSSADSIKFSATRYETFEQSFDMFQDGRIVLVPLAEEHGKVAGVFVNLVSGRRYFLAPTVRSDESLARIRGLAGKWPAVTVIVPEDARARERVAQFPEFRR